VNTPLNKLLEDEIMNAPNTRIRVLLYAAVWATIFSLIRGAGAQDSFPLYCKGPLHTSPKVLANGHSSTHFKWSSQGAGAKSPGRAECAWADRGPRGTEIRKGDGNVICDFSDLLGLGGLSAGKYWEIGVFRDPSHDNCMHATQFVGIVKPPFSPDPVLPPK
jgi:hypothetical protein